MMGLTVTLKHAPNPDIRGGYWDGPVDSAKPQHVLVPSLPAAQNVVRAYIERNSLGGGNWTGGELMLDGRPIGRISYNGRVWHLGDFPTAEMTPSDPILGCYAAVAS